MIKYIVLCAIIAVCTAKSMGGSDLHTLLNKDPGTPELTESKAEPDTSTVNESKAIALAAEESPQKSNIDSLLANIESIDRGTDTDQTKLLFAKLSTTTKAPPPQPQNFTLVLGLNSNGPLISTSNGK